VLAHDRPGLLAATTGSLANAGLSVIQAAAMTWQHRGWALQRVLVADPKARSTRPVERDLLCAQLRSSVRDSGAPEVSFAPAGPARVTATTDERDRRLLRVVAPDRPGLLWAISAWLEKSECNVLVARAAPVGMLADDSFLVEGSPDETQLAAHLSGTAAPAPTSV
jgi:UTP:GlnB (protein PII) uridylyltransferase